MESFVTKNCQVCQKPAKHKCGNCSKIYYCSREHQKDDWKKHRNRCKVFKISEDHNGINFLVSTQNIKAGDFILQESPLIWSPAFQTNPVCLGCGKVLNEENSQPCRKCGWPVCCDLCQKSPTHLPECKFTTQQNVWIKKFDEFQPIYKCVAILRYIYHKQYLPKSSKKLEKFEKAWELRKGSVTFKKREVAEFTRRFFKLLSVLTADDILKIYEIFMMNSLEVSTENLSYIGIFNNASLLQHSCTSNCTKLFTTKGQIIIKAVRDVEKGEPLTISHVNPLLGTPNRRQYLYEQKFFWCHCPRCKDPKEFGTNFSAFKCQTINCDGITLPRSFTDPEAKWSCNKCTKSIPLSFIDEIVERVEQDIKVLNRRSVEDCRNFYTSYRAYLYESNCYFFEIKLLLSQLLDHDFQKKYEICDSLEKLIGIVAPGEILILGKVLVEKCKAFLEICQERCLEHMPLQEQVEKVVDLLKEVPEDCCIQMTEQLTEMCKLLGR